MAAVGLLFVILVFRDIIAWLFFSRSLSACAKILLISGSTRIRIGLERIEVSSPIRTVDSFTICEIAGAEEIDFSFIMVSFNTSDLCLGS